MKLSLVALCLMAASSYQQVTCKTIVLETSPVDWVPTQEELKARQQLESLPKPIDWFNIEQVKDVLMDLIKNIQHSWQLRKDENLNMEADKKTALKEVVIDELNRFLDDMRLRQKHRELSQQWRGKFSPNQEENTLKHKGNLIMDSLRMAGEHLKHFTDENGNQRPIHEHILMDADDDDDLSDTEENVTALSSVPPNGLTDDEIRNMMKKPFNESVKSPENGTSNLRKEKIGSIKRKTEAFLGEMFKAEIKDLAFLFIQEAVASKNLDMKSTAVRVIVDRLLKNLAFYICDVLTDLLAIIFERDFMHKSPASTAALA